MSKNKYLVAAALIVGGGLFGGFLLLLTTTKQYPGQSISKVQGAYTEVPLSETSDPNSVPLSSLNSSSKSSGGLSVAPNSSTNNLGQLTPNIDGTSSSSDNSSSTAKPIDPTTFGQYDRYKDDANALFGELQVGTGDELTAGKKAAVYYKGWLTDGRLFDSTRADKDGKLQPFVFEMGAHQVIPGWEEGLLGMKVGGTRLIIVPPSVGYGAAGQDPIPANAVLVFQVQLLAVQ